MKILDGKALSLEIKNQLKEKVSEFKQKYNKEITLAVILVGENPASKIYVNNKIKAAEYIGLKSISLKLPEDSTQKEVEDLILSLSNDNNIDGILIQLPLPRHLDEDYLLNLIPVSKDVDGFTEINAGKLSQGKDCLLPCTPAGIIELIKSENIEISGKNAVVIGRSNIVGKPIANLLLKENCTVTVCHSKTNNIADFSKNADILIVAIGKPMFVTADMVKEGAVVVDVGINRTENGLKGDVDYESVKDKTSFITPVPGGVGPMTIAMLMKNTYLCALKKV